MSKNPDFIRPFDKWQSKGDQILVKSKRNHLYQIYRSLWRQVSWKKSLLVLCKVLKMFVNILTTDDKRFLVNRDSLRQPINTQLSQKKNYFMNLFLQFWNLNKILKIFKKKMTLMADVFAKLRTPKNVVR